MTSEGPHMGASIALDNVHFAYEGGAAMVFDLAIAPSEIVAVMGPSGSGKSTLLNLIAGFELPTLGTVLFDGKGGTRLSPAKRPVSMVFQENNLFAHLDVEANVGLGRSPSLKLTDADRADIADALSRTGLAGKEARLPSALSGGERQRVALARVLVRDRPILLLDEAFGSLGPALKGEMLDLVGELHAERGMTLIMATHDPDDSRRIAEKVIFIEAGRVAGAGSAADFLSGNGPAAFKRYIGATSGTERAGAKRKNPDSL